MPQNDGIDFGKVFFRGQDHARYNVLDPTTFRAMARDYQLHVEQVATVTSGIAASKPPAPQPTFFQAPAMGRQNDPFDALR